MNKIQIECFTPDEDVKMAEMFMCTAAKLTQNGEKWTPEEFKVDFCQPVRKKMVANLSKLPHPTLQKFGIITFVIFGASRRFLAQITRHQVDVHFMSASLQYSDYSDNAEFCVPYGLLDKPEFRDVYIKNCKNQMSVYETLVNDCGIDHDEAGYLAPQGLRNILIMSASIFEWKHIISQRVCRRNTLETRYVMLRIWEYLYDRFPELFAPETTGPFCEQGHCLEGRMSCGMPLFEQTPSEIIADDFPLLKDAPKCTFFADNSVTSV